MYLNLYGIVDEHFFLCVLFLFLYCLLCLTIYKYSFFFFALILSILHVTDLIVMRVETPEMTNAKEIRYKIHKWNRMFYMTLSAERIFGWFLANCILCFRLSDLMRYLIIYSECVLLWWNVFLFHHIAKPNQILSNSIYILNHLRFALLIPRLVTSCSYFFCFALFLFLLLILCC